jgi:hypothetical protein
MRNALELALEALEESKEHIAKHLRLEAINAIKEALDQIEPVQVSPLDFVEMVYEKEHLVGRPMIWAEWPVRDKNYRKGETD